MSPKDKELQKLEERDNISKYPICVCVFTLFQCSIKKNCFSSFTRLSKRSLYFIFLNLHLATSIDNLQCQKLIKL
jgi:hypothetical protein